MSKVINEVEEKPEETGGVVTTVKKNTTDDLDVAERIKDLGEGEQTRVKEDKPAEKVVVKVKEDDDDDEFDPKSLPPKAQRLLNSANKERRLLARQVKELGEQINELKTVKPADTRPAAPKQLVRPVKPNPATFEGTPEEFRAAEEKYDVDNVEYVYLTKRSEELRDEEIARHKSDEADTIVAFNAAVAEFVKTHEDYTEVMQENEVELTPIMFGMVVEEGPALGYYFAQHPDEAAAIAAVTDNQEARKSRTSMEKAEKKAIRMIDRIIVKLEAENKPPEKKEGELATPPKKKSEPPAVLTGSGEVAQRERSKLSFKEREDAYRKEHPGELNY